MITGLHRFFSFQVAVADQGGGPEARPPAPVKTSQKRNGRHAVPQIVRVIGPPLGQISGSATES